MVSLCFTGFIYQSTHGVDIETIDGYRGKDLAKKTAYLLARECLDHGESLYWDCMEVNYPSNAIALKLGFTLFHQYHCYEYKL
jgi:RimJ/RimL family protein N-acetyltransferase